MGNKKAHPTKSFEQYVADATSQKLAVEIDARVNNAVNQALAFTGGQVSKLLTRLLSVEQILMEKFPEINSEFIEARAHQIEALAAGYSEDRTAIEPGALVRMSVQIQATPEAELSNPQVLVISNFGSGSVLSSATESSLIGLAVGDQKSLVLADQGGFTAHFTPISVKIKPGASQAQSSQPASSESASV